MEAWHVTGEGAQLVGVDLDGVEAPSDLLEVGAIVGSLWCLVIRVAVNIRAPPKPSSYTENVSAHA